MAYARIAMIGALTLSIGAAHATGREDIWPTYWRTLEQACPAKHLEMLGPADLRAALEDYKAQLSAVKHARLSHVEKKQCRGDADPVCRNLVDLRIAEDHHMLGSLSQAICDRFTLCRGQSDCDRVGAGDR